ncbi:MAG TPA: 2OG-Fe(II) oxygenase [Paucimonas sp.]|nr:2OG-Fe(II) oxygenase [Paucimonas sp.]
MNQVPPEWVKWIDENIARGVPQQNLIDTMTQHRFDRTLAMHAVLSRTPGYLVQRQAPVISTAASVATDARRAAADQFDYTGVGIEVGNTVDIDGHRIPVLMKVDKPRVILFGNVLTRDECEQLIEMSKSRLSRSTTVDDQTGKAEHHEHRTSHGTFFALNENPFIAGLDQRIARLMQLPVANGEGLQILNYRIGGEYKPHYDYFPPQLPGSAPHIARGGQRVATLVIYLNDVEEGGETIFPNIDLKVVPLRGCAVYFAYTNARDQVDPLTYHGGNPVTKGEKWIATKWMRQREYR